MHYPFICDTLWCYSNLTRSCLSFRPVSLTPLRSYIILHHPDPVSTPEHKDALETMSCHRCSSRGGHLFILGMYTKEEYPGSSSSFADQLCFPHGEMLFLDVFASCVRTFVCTDRVRGRMGWADKLSHQWGVCTDTCLQCSSCCLGL